MTQATGTVQSITNKSITTKLGIKPVYSAQVGGQWFDFGFKKPTFNVGDNVTFEYTDGTFGKKADPASVSVAGGTLPAPKSAMLPSYNGKAFPVPALHPDRSIVRQNSVTNARELVSSAGTFYDSGEPTEFKVNSWDEAADIIIKLARKFEAYSCGDLDVERAKELSGE